MLCIFSLASKSFCLFCMIEDSQVPAEAVDTIELSDKFLFHAALEPILSILVDSVVDTFRFLKIRCAFSYATQKNRSRGTNRAKQTSFAVTEHSQLCATRFRLRLAASSVWLFRGCNWTCRNDTKPGHSAGAQKTPSRPR